jgi:hypothetical protein
MAVDVVVAKGITCSALMVARTIEVILHAFVACDGELVHG